MGANSSTVSEKTRVKVWTLHQQGLSNSKIADRIGVSARTIARIVNQQALLHKTHTKESCHVGY